MSKYISCHRNHNVFNNLFCEHSLPCFQFGCNINTGQGLGKRWNFPIHASMLITLWVWLLAVVPYSLKETDKLGCIRSFSHQRWEILFLSGCLALLPIWRLCAMVLWCNPLNVSVSNEGMLCAFGCHFSCVYFAFFFLLDVYHLLPATKIWYILTGLPACDDKLFQIISDAQIIFFFQWVVALSVSQLQNYGTRVPKT